jgi:hypothetical protein
MVSLPARDKGRAPSPVKAASGEEAPVAKGELPSPTRGAGNENAGVQPELVEEGLVVSLSSQPHAGARRERSWQ